MPRRARPRGPRSKMPVTATCIGALRVSNPRKHSSSPESRSYPAVPPTQPGSNPRADVAERAHARTPRRAAPPRDENGQRVPAFRACGLRRRTSIDNDATLDPRLFSVGIERTRFPRPGDPIMRGRMAARPSRAPRRGRRAADARPPARRRPAGLAGGRGATPAAVLDASRGVAVRLREPLVEPASGLSRDATRPVPLSRGRSSLRGGSATAKHLPAEFVFAGKLN
jgi:hypothetical protein